MKFLEWIFRMVLEKYNLKNTIFLKILISVLLMVLMLSSIFLVGCKSEQAKKEALQITVEKVYEIIKDKNRKYFILDVRTKEEFDSGHLESAALIPVDDMESRLSELPEDKPIIVYCRTGRRSTKAAEILINNNFAPVYDMSGGIELWKDKGYPVIVENEEAFTLETSSQAELLGENENGNENNNNKTTPSEEIQINYITSEQLYEWTGLKKDLIILDVRSGDSYSAIHIKNAISIPFYELDDRINELESDSDKLIVVYCSNFDCGLSKSAVEFLFEKGFKNLFALSGGIENWQSKGYPVE